MISALSCGCFVKILHTASVYTVQVLEIWRIWHNASQTLQSFHTKIEICSFLYELKQLLIKHCCSV